MYPSEEFCNQSTDLEFLFTSVLYRVKQLTKSIKNEVCTLLVVSNID